MLKEDGKLGTIVYRNTTVGKYSDMAGCQANFAFQILINCKGEVGHVGCGWVDWAGVLEPFGGG